MEKLIFLFVIMCFYINIKAQDIILLMNGDVIKAKVIEILPKEIKYKNFDSLNGTTLSIIRTEVVSIKYENGNNEVFGIEQKNKKLSDCIYLPKENPNGRKYKRAKLIEILKKDTNVIIALNKYIKYRKASMIITPISVGMIVGGSFGTLVYYFAGQDMSGSSNYHEPKYNYYRERNACLVVMVAGVGLLFYNTALNRIKLDFLNKAIRTFNSKFNCQNNKGFSLYFGLASQGVGFKIRF